LYYKLTTEYYILPNVILTYPVSVIDVKQFPVLPKEVHGNRGSCHHSNHESIITFLQTRVITS